MPDLGTDQSQRTHDRRRIVPEVETCWDLPVKQQAPIHWTDNWLLAHERHAEGTLESVVRGLDGSLIAGCDVQVLEFGPTDNFEPTTSSRSSRHASVVSLQEWTVELGIVSRCEPMRLVPARIDLGQLSFTCQSPKHLPVIQRRVTALQRTLCVITPRRAENSPGSISEFPYGPSECPFGGDLLYQATLR